MDGEAEGDAGLATRGLHQAAVTVDRPVRLTERPPVVRLPRLARNLVERPRLLALLDARTPLTVLRAPVGYGKTTLVGQWLRRQERQSERVAWVRIGSGHGTPGEFWVEVVDALTDAGLPLPSLPQYRSPQALAERMLTAHEGPLLLILDRFDAVSEHTVDVRLIDLLWNCPDLRLIVCLRTHEHFGPDQVGDLDVTLVGAPDLLFTTDEITDLFATVGAQLTPGLAEDLHAELGGWAEPVKLLAVALRDGVQHQVSDVRAIAAAIATDYLRGRLLPQPCAPERVRFALSTSVPDEFTVATAQVLSADPAAGDHVAWLEREGMLLVESGRGEPVYRWPGAARLALRQELTRRHSELLPDLHTRLARHYLADDQAGPAVRHAVAAQDWPLVVQVVDAKWRQLLLGPHKDLYQAMQSTPLANVTASTRALAVRDIVLGNPDDRVLALANLPHDSADSTGSTELGDPDHVRDRLDTGLALLVALRRRGRFDHASTYSDRLLEIATEAQASRPEDVIDLLPNTDLQIGLTRMLADDLGGGVEPLERAYERAADSTFDYVESASAASLALAHAVIGDTRTAAVWLHRHDTATAPSTWLATQLRAAADDARLLIALDRLELDVTSMAPEPLTGVAVSEFTAFAVYARAQYALHLGTRFDALALLDRTRAARQAWLGHGATAGPLLAAVEADLLLALGKGNQARAVLYGEFEDHPSLRVGQARLALLSGEPEAALRTASHTAWTRTATPRDRLDMLLIRAVAAHRIDNVRMAVEALHRAAGEVCASGSLRAFAGVPRADLTVLAREVPVAAELLMQLPLAMTPDLFPSDVQVVHLTEREHRVLGQLSRGLTLQQVADALVVSYNTVKTQQRSIYRKLKVETRDEAIAQARRWGLL